MLTLWIGRALTFVERACLRSARRHGHQVALYCYDEPAGVPEGIEIRDARDILSPEAIIRHRSGRPALFSNRFRYELQRRSLGIWIDCDLYFVAPLSEPGDTLFGNQGSGTINSAVLRLPKNSPILLDLLTLFDQQNVPPWLDWRSRLAARWRLAVTGCSGLDRMPWGSTGPNALTWLAKAYGEAGKAKPPSRFYPVPWPEADWVMDPDRRLDDVILPDTVAVHLWNERLRLLDLHSAPAGSFAARLRKEGAE